MTGVGQASGTRASAMDLRPERRVLDTAIQCFAEFGYAGTTAECVASRAGVATEMLGKHFRSKCDLYLAAFDQAESFAYEHLRSVAEAQPTLVARLESMVRELLRLRDVCAGVGRFLGTVNAETAQNAELRTAGRTYWPRQRALLEDLVETGVVTGELAPVDRLVAVDTLTALLGGLWAIGDLLPGSESSLAEGIQRLIAGSLLSKT